MRQKDQVIGLTCLNMYAWFLKGQGHIVKGTLWGNCHFYGVIARAPRQRPGDMEAIAAYPIEVKGLILESNYIFDFGTIQSFVIQYKRRYTPGADFTKPYATKFREIGCFISKVVALYILPTVWISYVHAEEKPLFRKHNLGNVSQSQMFLFPSLKPLSLEGNRFTKWNTLSTAAVLLTI